MTTTNSIITLLPAAALMLAATACGGSGHACNDSENLIWFDTPGNASAAAPWLTADGYGSNPDPDWERVTVPIGNGSLGGAIFGPVSRERVVLNEKTLWTGGPGAEAEDYWAMNRKVSPDEIARIRTALERGDNDLASELVSASFRGNIDYDRSLFGTFTVMGEAYVTTGINDSTVTSYRRQLDIDRALATVSFTADGTDYQRQYFCSYPDSVMAWRFTSDRAPQNLTFSFDTPQTITSVTAEGDNSLLWCGQIEGNGMRWALRVLVRTGDKGEVKADAATRTITASGSDDVEFLLAGDTDYRLNFDPDMTDPHTYIGTDPAATVNAVISAAGSKTWNQLLDSHLDDYTVLYGRVSLDVGTTVAENSKLPTPERLQAYREGTADPDLEETYFQYGRYLLIASSRPGSMPANLQGLWSNNIDGPWHVDYHNNINLQMNYWPATITNLTECFTPLIDYTRSLVKPGRITATDYYGARGWTAGISTNVFGFTAPLNSGDMTWNYNPSAGPWLATQMWEYYDYTRDTLWLRTVGYDLIKSSADFVSDMLHKANGSYTWAPSYSPEHGKADMGATYANAIAREALTNAIEAATLLHRDPTSVTEWRNKLDSIVPYRIGRYGQLQEWYEDIDQYDDPHRHTNHLFGLHPGRTIDANTDTLLANACRETLRQRGDAATGWSMGWKLNHWARLHDGDHAYTLLHNLLSNGTSDNLWDVHPPFQIDGNFGGTAGIAEMLLQSHTGKLHLLPALPAAWPDGRVSGLLARGNFEVGIDWHDGRLSTATITSRSGGPCTVIYNGATVTADTRPGQKLTVGTDADGNLTIN